MWRRILLIAVVGCALSWGDLSVAPAGEMQLVHSIDLPDGVLSAYDLAWDGQYLYVPALAPTGAGSWGAGTYKLNAATGEVVSLLALEGLPLRSGAAWDGADLWTTRAVGASLVGPPVYTHTMERLSTDDGTVLWSETYVDSNVSPAGLAWDGSHLWLSDPNNLQINRIDPLSMSVVASFSAPGTDPRGLAWDGNSLWCVDGASDLVYQLDTAGNVIESWTVPGSDPFGITFDGEYFWVSDNDALQVHQLAVPEPSVMWLLSSGALFVAIAMCRRFCRSV